MSKWALMLTGAILMAALAIVACESSPSEDEGVGATSTQAQAVSSGDRDFALQAIRGGRMEVDMGQLIQQRASSEELRRYGQRLVNDHRKANQELSDIAQRKGLSVPQDIGAENRRNLDMLSESTGRDFDREAIRHAITDHEKDIAAYEQASRSAEDPDIRAYATRTLPTLRQHLAQARDLASQLGVAR